MGQYDVARLAGAIAAGDLDEITDLFLRHDAPLPDLVWRPYAESIPSDTLKVLYDYWERLRGNRRFPLAAEVDAVDMREALGHIMLLDVIDGGQDFRYRVYGTKIADRSGFDMTGKRTSEVRTDGYVRDFFLAIYRAVLLRGEPVFTNHAAPPRITAATWNRLILPLADDSGAIVRLLVGNVPHPWRESLSTVRSKSQGYTGLKSFRPGRGDAISATISDADRLPAVPPGVTTTPSGQIAAAPSSSG